MKNIFRNLIGISLLVCVNCFTACSKNVDFTNKVDERDNTEEVAENETITNFETAETAVANMKCGWNLGNSLDCYGTWIGQYATSITGWETAWGNPVIREELIHAVKEAGFNAIRVPVTWRDHIDSEGVVDTVWMNHVVQIVNLVLNENLYCIINVHHDNGGDDDAWLVADKAKFNGGMAKRYENLWKQIAETFKDYDNKLLFSGLNETLDASHNWAGSTQEAYGVVNNLNQLFVNTVRATGGNNAFRNLIVQTYGASSAASQVNGFTKPKDNIDNHLIAEVHIYDPSDFCTGKDTIWDSKDESALTTIFNRLNTNIIQKYGMPLIVGEFGSQDHTENSTSSAMLQEQRANYARFFFSSARKYGITCFWWDDGGSMKLFWRSIKFQPCQPKIVSAIVEN